MAVWWSSTNFLVLAFKEVLRGLRRRRPPGGRDFAYLLVLLAILQLFGMVIGGARDGVLERSVDALLGNVPNKGVPIWVRSNALSRQASGAITRDILAEIQLIGVEVEPFRRTFGGDHIRLPAPRVWTEPSVSSEPAFSGVFAKAASPLRGINQAVADTTVDPEVEQAMWPIVLERERFQRYFDRAAYAAALVGRAPTRYVNSLQGGDFRLEELDIIWLQVNGWPRRMLIPFRIVWSDYLGAGLVAPDFVLPMHLHTRLSAARSNPSACIDTATAGLPSLLVSDVRSESLLLADQATIDRVVEPMAASFRQMEKVHGGSSKLTLPLLAWAADTSKLDSSGCNVGLPWVVASIFATSTGLGMKDFVGLSKRLDDDVISEEASYSLPSDLVSSQVAQRGQKKGGTYSLNLENAVDGYDEALLFASSRGEILATVAEIGCTAPRSSERSELCMFPHEEAEGIESRITLHRSYLDSLTRFGFLSNLLDLIAGPVGLIFLSLLGAIAWVQLGTVLDHRKTQYATFIVCGMRPGMVLVFVCAQIVFCTGLGFFIASFLFWCVRETMLALTVPLTLAYDRITTGQAVDVFPISLSVSIIVPLTCLFVSLALAIIHLWWKGVLAAKKVDELI